MGFIQEPKFCPSVWGLAVENSALCTFAIFSILEGSQSPTSPLSWPGTLGLPWVCD